MTLLIALLTLPWIAGMAAMLIGIRNAPEAAEDGRGFRLIWQNNSPKARDVVCIWTDSANQALA